ARPRRRTMAAEPGLTGDPSLQLALTLVERRSHAAAERALAELPARVRQTPAWILLHGVTQTRLGHIDAACATLQPLARGSGPWAAEATAALADALYLGHRLAALRDLL